MEFMKKLLIIITILFVILLLLREFYPIKLLTQKESYELYDTMDKTNKFMRKNNLQYFITCGTLLGAVRHKGIIPYDKDVDIAMIDTEFEKLLNNKEKLKEFGLLLNYDDYIWRIEKMDGSGMYIDVFLYKKEGDKYIYTEPKNTERWPKEYLYEHELYPLVELDFGEYKLFAPNNYKKILERYYGDDYMNPYYFGQGSNWFDKLITMGKRRVYL
jgi:lipopolysaccharide cholinephosphotransferase